MNLLNEMYEKNLQPLDVTYNSIIYACSSRVDTYLQGFDILNKMRTHGFAPDLITFSSLLYGCAKAGDLASAYAVWSEIQSRFFLFFHFISFFYLETKRKEFFFFWKKKRGLEPNKICYTNMMWALATKNHFEQRREKRLQYVDKFHSLDNQRNPV